MTDFATVSEVMDALYTSVLGFDDDATLSEIIAKLSSDHIAHKLSSMAYRCTGCGYSDFVITCYVDLETHENVCPACYSDAKLQLLQGGAA